MVVFKILRKRFGVMSVLMEKVEQITKSEKCISENIDFGTIVYMKFFPFFYFAHYLFHDCLMHSVDNLSNSHITRSISQFIIFFFNIIQLNKECGAECFSINVVSISVRCFCKVGRSPCGVWALA